MTIRLRTAAAAAFVLLALQARAVELTSNGTFPTSTSGWSAGAGAVVGWNGTGSAGAGSAMVSTLSNGTVAATQCFVDLARVRGHFTYALSGQIRVDAGDPATSARISVNFSTGSCPAPSGGTTSTTDAVTTATAGTWVPVTVPRIEPSGGSLTALVSLAVSGSGAATASALFDDVSLRLVARPPIATYGQHADSLGDNWFHYFAFPAGTDAAIFTADAAASCRRPLLVDVDGDGLRDHASYCNGSWSLFGDDGQLVRSLAPSWQAGDIPAPGDYDGDGRTEHVVFRQGAWLFFDAVTGVEQPSRHRWTGMPASWTSDPSIPVPMDYDGDGDDDFTIWSGGAWHFFKPDGTYDKGIWCGSLAGTLPVPADYDGLGRDQVVVFRGGAWHFFDFATGAWNSAQSVWTGHPPAELAPASLPAPIDMDSDGDADPAIYSGDVWHVYNRNGTYRGGVRLEYYENDHDISLRPFIPWL